MLDWIVVQSKPGYEALAAACVQRQGFECYYPVIPGARGRAKALFPRYFFAKTKDLWYPIKNTIGVSSIVVKGDGYPARIDSSVVEDLRESEVNGLIRLPEPPRFMKGQKLRVRDQWHLLARHELLVEGMPDKHRVTVLFRLFGAKQRVSLNVSQVIEVA
jgi:transcription antitermination factor NusG